MILHYLSRFRGQDLKARCARGSLALTSGTIVSKTLALISKMVLTRLLLKNEIGLMVMLLSLLSFFETIMEVGVRKSVIQSKHGDTPEYLNTAWWFQGMRSLLLYGVAFLISPWLSHFYFSDKLEVLEIYSIDELCTLMRVTFLYTLLNGFTSPRLQVLTRQFRFAKKVILTSGSAAAGIIITIVLAFTMQNVWAIVIGNLAGAGLLLVFSYIACPFLPRFSLHKESLASILKFARGMAGLPILTYFAFNTDVLVLGKVLDTAFVGMYGMALVIANVPRDLFTRIISPVLLPAFAEKQERKQSLRRGVLTLAKFSSLITFPGVIVAAGCGKTILSVIYTPQYGQVAVVFGVLCSYIAVIIQTIPLTQIFYGIGRPGQERLFVMFRTLLIVLLIYPAVKGFGLLGAAGTLLAAGLAGLMLQIWLLKREIGLRISRYIAAWLPGLGAAGIQFLILIAAFFIWPEKVYIRLGIMIITYAVIITGALFYHVRIRNVYQTVKPTWKKPSEGH